MRISMLSDRVLVRPDDREVASKGGVLLPDRAQERPKAGVVLDVGPGKVLPDGSLSRMDVTAGDRVVYARYAGSDVELDGVEHRILSMDDVLAVIRD